MTAFDYDDHCKCGGVCDECYPQPLPLWPTAPVGAAIGYAEPLGVRWGYFKGFGWLPVDGNGRPES